MMQHQTTPQTDESEANAKDPLDAPLPLAGFEGTPEEIERQWFEQVYTGRGDSMAQLTWRAVIMGSLLGGLLSLTNIYIGLKTGWAFGVAITSCILSYSIWTTLHKIGLARTKMTILENNCMQSTASAAGYSTGGTLVSAIAAYIIIYGETIPTYTLMGWVFFLAVLGVTMAIPMKRQMINIEQLRFPSGIAAAETLKSLYTTGTRGLRSAKALAFAGMSAGFVEIMTNGLHVIANKLASPEHPSWFAELLRKVELGPRLAQFNEWLLGHAWVGRTVELSWDPIFLAAGAITGMRVCTSMMIGAMLCWTMYVPLIQVFDVTNAVDYDGLIEWTLWAGVACMVTSGLLTFGMQWRSALRAFSSLGNLFGRSSRSTDDALTKIETPMAWFVGGQVFGTAGLAVMAHYTFDMPAWLCVFAVLLSFPLALVACRVTGETDITPVGPMGKITQLTFGGIAPGSKTINLMGACVTAGAADSSSDLLIDLKSGYLLGANPRKQFIAQFAGIFAGTIVSVLCFNAIVGADADILRSKQFPAPSAVTWAAVAEALSQGLTDLEAPKKWCILIGGLIGILLPLLERAYPKKLRAIPSAAGLGLAWTFPWSYSLVFFFGALIGAWFERSVPKASEEFTFPIASGLIAGGGLMGVTLIFLEYGGQMFTDLFAG